MSRIVPTIETREVLKLKKEGYKIIDVRSSDEYSGELSHIPESQLVTLGDELESFLSKTDQSEKIIFVCRSGARSGRATELALGLGIRNVLNMIGGMLKWNEDGLEVET